MNAVACMGGWCHRREQCQHYHADDRSDPAERLCVPGHDGIGAAFPIRILRPIGAWEMAANKRLDQVTHGTQG